MRFPTKPASRDGKEVFFVARFAFLSGDIGLQYSVTIFDTIKRPVRIGCTAPAICKSVNCSHGGLQTDPFSQSELPLVAPLNLFIAWCPSLQLNCVRPAYGRKQALAAQFDADVDDFLRENEELKDKAWRRMSRHVNCYTCIIDLLCKFARAVLLRPVTKAHRLIGVKASTVWVAIRTLRNSFLIGKDTWS